MLKLPWLFKLRYPYYSFTVEDLVCETSISRISAPCMMFGPQLWQGSHGKRQGCRRFVQLMMCFSCLIWPQAPGSTSWKVLNCPCAEAWTWMKILKHQWFKTRKCSPKLIFVIERCFKAFWCQIDWQSQMVQVLMTFQLALGLVGLPVLARRAWSEGVIVLENRTLS